MNQNFIEYAEVPMLLENTSTGQILEIDKIKFEPAPSGMMGDITFFVNPQESFDECLSVKKMFKYLEILESYDQRGYAKKDLTGDFILYEYTKGERIVALELFSGILTEANWTDLFATVTFDYFKINPTSRIAKYFKIVSKIDDWMQIPRHTIHCMCEQCQQHELEGVNDIQTNIYR